MGPIPADSFKKHDNLNSDNLPIKPIWQKWNGKSDLGMVVLVKTEDGIIVTAQQPKGLPEYWVIYEPGTPILFQPELKSKVVEYIDLKLL